MPTQHTLHNDTHLRVLRLLQSKPQMSQRDLAQALGISLGKVNYCIQALLGKGWLKMQNFMGSRNKLGYSYLLTAQGVSEKALLTKQFLERKISEYEALQAEIELLRKEAHTAQGAAA